MNDYENWNLNGYCLEYLDDTHCYLVDGVIVPSVTQILKKRFGHKYDFVNPNILQKAADKGTALHEAVESYCKYGIETDLKELRNFKFLQKNFGFEVVENEIPIVLHDKGKPIAAGRLDLVLREKEFLGLGDIKCVSALDKEYLGYQLNIYRIGYMQTYGKEIRFLRGLHLRENVRKYVELPINPEMAWDLIYEFMEGNE